MGTTNKTIVAAIAAFSLATAAPAFAEDSSLEGYGGPGSDVLSEIQQPSNKAAEKSAPVSNQAGESARSSGTLPFTGLDLGLLGAAGAGLLGLGIAMRRLTRSSETA
jgi:2-methylaconitate cis-trans-isomerase PrpF